MKKVNYVSKDDKEVEVNKSPNTIEDSIIAFIAQSFYSMVENKHGRLISDNRKAKREWNK